MLIEFLYRLFTADLAWIIDFILSQLFWVFLFAAVVAILYDKGKQLWGFFLFVFFIWAFVDVGFYMGWKVGPSYGALFFALFSLPAYVFLQKKGVLSKYNLPYQILGVILLWIFFTFFG